MRIMRTENLGVWEDFVAKTKDEWTFVHNSFHGEIFQTRTLYLHWITVSLSLSSSQYCRIEFSVQALLSLSLFLWAAAVESKPDFYCKPSNLHSRLFIEDDSFARFVVSSRFVSFHRHQATASFGGGESKSS